MHPEVLRSIGGNLGSVLEVDTDDGGQCFGKFSRLRITRNIHQPLSKGLWITSEDGGDKVCIVVLYERLPNFCFACGRIGHIVRDCDDSSANKDILGFGSWLKAPSFDHGRKSGSNKGHEGSEKTSSSSRTTYKPDLVSKRALIVHGDIKDSDHMDQPTTDIDNLIDRPIVISSQTEDRKQIPTRVVLSSTEQECQPGVDIMICSGDSYSAEGSSLVLPTDPNNITTWKRLVRNKGKAHIANMNVIGTKRVMDSTVAQKSGSGRGTKIDRTLISYNLSTAEAAVQPRRSQ